MRIHLSARDVKDNWAGWSAARARDDLPGIRRSSPSKNSAPPEGLRASAPNLMVKVLPGKLGLENHNRRDRLLCKTGSSHKSRVLASPAVVSPTYSRSYPTVYH